MYVDIKNVYIIFFENQAHRDNLGDLNVMENKIRWILEVQDVRVLTGFICPAKDPVAVPSEQGNDPLGSTKEGKFLFPNERQTAFQLDYFPCSCRRQ
jgi:hypothetical protein